MVRVELDTDITIAGHYKPTDFQSVEEFQQKVMKDFNIPEGEEKLYCLKDMTFGTFI